MESTPAAFWHTTPLHYSVPLLLSGGLLSKARLAAAGLPIRPRPTALRRDRKLALCDYIHLSFTARTPLLADKRARGYPHVLLEFSTAVADLPGAAFLAYNTKAWQHREAFAPLLDAEDKAAFRQAWRAGKYPSAELLVPGVLPLAPYALALHAATEPEADWLRSFAPLLPDAPAVPIRVTPNLFPPAPPLDLTAYLAYREDCLRQKTILPPPDLPFD